MQSTHGGHLRPGLSLYKIWMNDKPTGVDFDAFLQQEGIHASGEFVKYF